MDTNEKCSLKEELERRITLVEQGNPAQIKRMTRRDYALTGIVILGCLAAVTAGYFLV